MVERKIDLSVLNPSSVTIDAVQDDTGRQIVAHITDMTIPGGAKARVSAIKPDGKRIYNDCEISGDDVVIEITRQYLTIAGKTQAQVSIFDADDKVVTTFAFTIKVHAKTYGDDAVKSTNEMSALVEALHKAENWERTTKEDADRAEAAAAYIEHGIETGVFKGDPGYTPIKGVDYFDGEPGYTPIKGKDYFDGEPGEPGHTPVKGTDYWTAEDKEEIVTEATEAVENSEAVSRKLDKPTEAPSVGKVLKVKSVNPDGTFVCEWAEDGGEPADYEQVKEQVAEHDRDIANLDYASKDSIYREEVDTAEAYSKTIPDGVLPYGTVDMLGGKSVVVNQLIAPTQTTRTTINGIEFAKDDRGVWYANGTATENVTFALLSFTECNIQKNHKLYVVTPKEASGSSVHIEIALRNASNVMFTDTHLYDAIGQIFTPSDDAIAIYYAPRVSSGYTCNNVEFMPVVIDLTLMFGAGNEPTIEECKKLFSDYIPYTEPTLINVAVSEVVSAGRNLWDEEWEIGGLNSANGAFWNTRDRIRSKNKIYVAPNTAYSFAYPTSGISVNTLFYDADDNYLGDANISFTTPSNARYIRFATYGQYGAEYKNDIALFEGTIATDYVPYRTPQTIPTTDLISKYFPDGMKSAGTVHDELDIENGVAVQRVGAVDLGTLTWDFAKNQSMYWSDIPNGSKADIVENTCAKYMSDNNQSTFLTKDKVVRGYGSTQWNFSRVGIRDTEFDGTASYLDGVTYNYELADPITTPIDPADIALFRQMQYEAGGTLTFENEMRMPVPNAETFYVKEHGLKDVQVNGESIVADGVANVPVINKQGDTGLAYLQNKWNNLIKVNTSGEMYVSSSDDSSIRSRNSNTALSAGNSSIAAFYGLAIAAGDTTQTSKSNSVGTYTDEAKTAIQQMLGILSSEGVGF